MLALLRFAENPRDRVAGFRVIQLLPGIGPAIAGQDARSHRRDCRSGRGAGWHEAAGRRCRALAGYSSRPFVWSVPAQQAGRPSSISCAAGTSRISIAFTRMPACARPILHQLVQIAATYPSRERFLTELTLDPPEATSDRAGAPLLDEDYLILSTIHSAKGQEWKSVHILNAVDGCLPSDLATGTSAEIEEERRLALCRHDAGAGSPRTSSCRSGSSSTVNAATATGTFMRRARASFRPGCWSISNVAAGRPPTATTAPRTPAHARRSIS